MSGVRRHTALSALWLLFVSQPLVRCVLACAALCVPEAEGRKCMCAHPPLATLLAYLYLLYNLPTHPFFIFFRFVCCVSVHAASLGASTRLISSLFSLLPLRLLCWLPVISMFFKPAGEKNTTWGVFYLVFLTDWAGAHGGGGGRCSCSKSLTCIFFLAVAGTLYEACEQLWAAKHKLNKKHNNNNGVDKTTSFAHLQMVSC